MAQDMLKITLIKNLSGLLIDVNSVILPIRTYILGHEGIDSVKKPVVRIKTTTLTDSHKSTGLTQDRIERAYEKIITCLDTGGHFLLGKGKLGLKIIKMRAMARDIYKRRTRMDGLEMLKILKALNLDVGKNTVGIKITNSKNRLTNSP
jgi:hypothetical protein